MKIKLLYGAILSILLIPSTYAVNTTYIDPDVSFLPASSSIWSAWPNDRIANNSISRNQFCFDLWWSLVSYTSEIITWDRANFSWTWDNEVATIDHEVLSDLICNIQENGIVGSWALVLWTINNWQLYIYPDSVYMVIVDYLVTVFFLFLIWKFIVGVRIIVFWK
jgi:hypothetical protein